MSRHNSRGKVNEKGVVESQKVQSAMTEKEGKEEGVGFYERKKSHKWTEK